VTGVTPRIHSPPLCKCVGCIYSLGMMLVVLYLGQGGTDRFYFEVRAGGGGIVKAVVPWENSLVMFGILLKGRF
jgi:hypothetical protein